MENYLDYYYKKYPKSEITDFIKLVYQATFGPGHLIKSPSISLSRLKEEIANLEPVNFYEDLYDFISDDYVRVNLRVYKKYNLNVNLLNESFLNTSYLFVDNNKTFKEELENLKTYLTNKGFNIDLLNNYFEDFVANNYPSLHHSETYRNEYQPAYRVIHHKYVSEELEFYQVRNYLEQFDKSKINFIALDGKAASGKTTIAKLLEKEYDVTVIHADDFFDYSDDNFGINSTRVIKEVFKQAAINRPLKYKKYNCTTKTFHDVIIDNLTSIVLVEGVYSSNPILENYYSGIIYVHVNDDNQNERLFKRNKVLYNRFINEWLPRENKYFKNYDPYKKANLIV